MHQRLPSRNGDQRGSTFEEAVDCLLHAHPPGQDLRRMLGLSASGTVKVAGKQRLELDHKRILVVASNALADEVPRDSQVLSHRDSHYCPPSRGRPSCSTQEGISRASTGPSVPTNAIMRSTRASGAEAPAVKPRVRTP